MDENLDKRAALLNKAAFLQPSINLRKKKPIINIEKKRNGKARSPCGKGKNAVTHF